MAQGPAFVDMTFAYKAKNITTAVSTLVKTGVGFLHLINVNKKGTVASVVQVYDGIDNTGTLLATIDSLNLQGVFQYDFGFTTGLYIVTTGTAAPDISVSYK